MIEDELDEDMVQWRKRLREANQNQKVRELELLRQEEEKRKIEEAKSRIKTFREITSNKKLSLAIAMDDDDEDEDEMKNGFSSRSTTAPVTPNTPVVTPSSKSSNATGGSGDAVLGGGGAKVIVDTNKMSTNFSSDQINNLPSPPPTLLLSSQSSLEKSLKSYNNFANLPSPPSPPASSSFSSTQATMPPPPPPPAIPKNKIQKVIRLTKKHGGKPESNFGLTFSGGIDLNRLLRVELVKFGSSADVCEVKRNDELLSVNDVDVTKMTVEQVMSLLNKLEIENSRVNLILLREKGLDSDDEEDSFSASDDDGGKSNNRPSNLITPPQADDDDDFPLEPLTPPPITTTTTTATSQKSNLLVGFGSPSASGTAGSGTTGSTGSLHNWLNTNKPKESGNVVDNLDETNRRLRNVQMRNSYFNINDSREEESLSSHGGGLRHSTIPANAVTSTAPDSSSSSTGYRPITFQYENKFSNENVSSFNQQQRNNNNNNNNKTFLYSSQPPPPPPPPPALKRSPSESSIGSVASHSSSINSTTYQEHVIVVNRNSLQSAINNTKFNDSANANKDQKYSMDFQGNQKLNSTPAFRPMETSIDADSDDSSHDAVTVTEQRDSNKSTLYSSSRTLPAAPAQDVPEPVRSLSKQQPYITKYFLGEHHKNKSPTSSSSQPPPNPAVVPRQLYSTPRVAATLSPSPSSDVIVSSRQPVMDHVLANIQKRKSEMEPEAWIRRSYEESHDLLSIGGVVVGGGSGPGGPGGGVGVSVGSNNNNSGILSARGTVDTGARGGNKTSSHYQSSPSLNKDIIERAPAINNVNSERHLDYPSPYSSSYSQPRATNDANSKDKFVEILRTFEKRNAAEPTAVTESSNISSWSKSLPRSSGRHQSEQQKSSSVIKHTPSPREVEVPKDRRNLIDSVMFKLSEENNKTLRVDPPSVNNSDSGINSGTTSYSYSKPSSSSLSTTITMDVTPMKPPREQARVPSSHMNTYSVPPQPPPPPPSSSSIISNQPPPPPPPPLPPKGTISPYHQPNTSTTSTSGGPSTSSSSIQRTTSSHRNERQTWSALPKVKTTNKCAHCGLELGYGAIMMIDHLQLFYHLNCFTCTICGKRLGDGSKDADVRIRHQRLHCIDCHTSAQGSLVLSHTLPTSFSSSSKRDHNSVAKSFILNFLGAY